MSESDKSPFLRDESTIKKITFGTPYLLPSESASDFVKSHDFLLESSISFCQSSLLCDSPSPRYQVGADGEASLNVD